jgi:hypothetical protein
MKMATAAGETTIEVVAGVRTINCVGTDATNLEMIDAGVVEALLVEAALLPADDPLLPHEGIANH